MNSKNTSYILLAIAAVGIGYFFYRKKRKQPESKKEEYISIITSVGNSQNAATLLGFELEFLKVWAEASQRGETTFTYKGKTHNTKGGKVYRSVQKTQSMKNMNSPIMNR